MSTPNLGQFKFDFEVNINFYWPDKKANQEYHVSVTEIGANEIRGEETYLVCVYDKMLQFIGAATVVMNHLDLWMNEYEAVPASEIHLKVARKGLKQIIFRHGKNI